MNALWDDLRAFFIEYVDVSDLVFLVGAFLSYGIFKWVIPNRHTFYSSLVTWIASIVFMFFIGLDPEGYLVEFFFAINLMAAGFFWLSMRDDYPE